MVKPFLWVYLGPGKLRLKRSGATKIIRIFSEGGPSGLESTGIRMWRLMVPAVPNRVCVQLELSIEAVDDKATVDSVIQR